MSSRKEAPQAADALFGQAVAIMARLRAPGGCPWDREQSYDSIRPYPLEETYEVFDAIDRRHWPDLAEELGDLLLQVLFYSQIAEEDGHFSIADVISGLNRKLIRRHPHVFGDQAAAEAGNAAAALETENIGSAQVLRNWKEIKRLEKETRSDNSGPAFTSRLDAIPRSFPALLEARKLGSKAAEAGFDWPQATDLLTKIEEETRELAAEMASPVSEHSIEEELGDLLFTAVNLARHLKIDPEMALRRTNAKFRSRFQAMEQAAAKPLEQNTPQELEALWAHSKQQEARQDS
ncbi:nucleoside triphosphate pyrophosphohydrolase [Acidipila rosea]|uniref:XTP/dITP diphosphohydrolase/ATP diphosphatase n=1 Tax=Acidipila rosea TaxID=768535 RepID=A0A4R1L5T4_9BACT|nr:nucleoside triphosphate pyrophosphohydrolase [Acidipila rosea]TCK73502.1 XTP/dITP diphosphohydrolase/ATP diphosphatase [Acidipila rosea]